MAESICLLNFLPSKLGAYILKVLQKDYKAFIFDLNGTMIDDMEYHIIGWHRILTSLGTNVSLEKTKQECYGKNHEFLERMLPGVFTNEEKDRMSLQKEEVYQEQYKPHLKLIEGLQDFLFAAREQQIKMAVGTAAIQFNVDFVLDELGVRSFFDVVVCANDVCNSKPHPETFLKCADTLSVLPVNCLVF